MSNNTKVGAAIVGLLTLLTAGLAFGEQLIGFIKPDEPPQVINSTSSENKKTRPSADIALKIGENPDTAVEATVSLNGDELGSIYTHQEPHQITEAVPEGRYNYALVVTYFSSPYGSQYSTNKCPDGTRVEGNGEISISDGDRFEVFDDCVEATLQELN